MLDRHAFALPGDRPIERPDLPWRLTHLALDVALDLDAGTVRGAATWTVAPQRPAPGPLLLDAHALEVESVELAGGEPVPWSNDGRQLELKLPPAPCEITLRYAATPTRGLHFIRPNENHPDKPRQVWSQGQDQDHHHWFPCLDHPAVRFTQEVAVTVDTGLTVLSNGHEIGRDDLGDGTTRHRWRFDTPHVTYLLTVAAGEFSRIELPDAPDGVDVYALGPADRLDDMRHNLAQTGEMMAFMADYLGVPYPYEQYAQVCVADFTFGGMENTSATTLTDRTLHAPDAEDDYSSQPLVAHELAHQWFGDLISCRDWNHAWLHEGFATYFDLLWHEHSQGADTFHLMLKAEADGYFHEDSARYRRPIVTQTRNAPIDIFDCHLYNKGSWVVHMLRDQVGEASFRAALGAYLREHGNDHVETSDLRRALEDATGQDLRWFFDQWTHMGGHPEIRGEARWDAEREEVELELKQTQKADATTPHFRLFLDVRVAAGDQIHEERIRLDGAEGTYRLKPGFRPERLVVDPKSTVLKTLRVKRPPEWIRAQLQHEPEAIARIHAATEIAESAHPKAVSDLGRALGEDSFRGVREAAAAELGRLRGDAAREALMVGLHDPHPRVRRAVCRALGAFLQDEAAAAGLRRVIAEDPSEYAVAAAAEALGKLRIEGNCELLEATAGRTSHSSAIARGAIRGMVFSREERGIHYAIAACGPDRPDMVRWTACGALGEAKVLKDEAREHLERSLDDGDFRFRLAAADAMRALGETKGLGALSRRRALEPDARVIRGIREATARLGEQGGQGDQVGRLEGEIEGLKTRIGALTDRLDKLQADG